MERGLILLLVLLAAAGCANSGSNQEATGTTTGKPESVPGEDLVNLLTQQFYSGELEDIHERFSDGMKEQVSLQQLRLMRTHMVENYGTEVELVGTEAQQDSEYRGFVRWARFDKFDGVIEIQWYLKPDDTIALFRVQPAKPEAGPKAP